MTTHPASIHVLAGVARLARVLLPKSLTGVGLVSVAIVAVVPNAFTYMLLYPLFRLLFGTLYPAYASYKAVRTKDVKEYVKWMMYWIVFALFTCAETFTDVFLSFWFPFYYECKIIIVIYLLSPATKGSSILYRKFVHPVLTRHEEEIDEYIARAKEQGYTTVLSLGSRGVNYATNILMQTALKSGGGFVNHLRKSYSLVDLPASHPNRPSHDETDDIYTDEDVRSGRRRRGRGPSPRRTVSSGGTTVAGGQADLYFSEVHVRDNAAAAAVSDGFLSSHIRSSEDVSSSRPADCEGRERSEKRERLSRTSSVSSVGVSRVRTRASFKAERTSSVTEKWDDASEDPLVESQHELQLVTSSAGATDPVTPPPTPVVHGNAVATDHYTPPQTPVVHGNACATDHFTPPQTPVVHGNACATDHFTPPQTPVVHGNACATDHFTPPQTPVVHRNACATDHFTPPQTPVVHGNACATDHFTPPQTPVVHGNACATDHFTPLQTPAVHGKVSSPLVSPHLQFLFSNLSENELMLLVKSATSPGIPVEDKNEGNCQRLKIDPEVSAPDGIVSSYVCEKREDEKERVNPGLITKGFPECGLAETVSNDVAIVIKRQKKRRAPSPPIGGSLIDLHRLSQISAVSDHLEVTSVLDLDCNSSPGGPSPSSSNLSLNKIKSKPRNESNLSRILSTFWQGNKDPSSKTKSEVTKSLQAPPPPSSAESFISLHEDASPVGAGVPVSSTSMHPSPFPPTSSASQFREMSYSPSSKRRLL